MLIMYELLLPPGMRVLKGGTVKEKSFCEFPSLALLKSKCRFAVTRIGHLLKPPNSFSFKKKKNRTKDFEKSYVNC